MDHPSVKNGIYGGVASIILTLIMWFINPEFLINYIGATIGFIVMLVFMYIGGFMYIINNNSDFLLGTISWSLVIGGSLLLVTVILLSNCNKNETDYYNESMIVDNFPWLSVYKTNGDYIDFIHIRVDSNDVITMSPSYNANSTRIYIDNDDKAHQNFKGVVGGRRAESCQR